MDSVFSDVFALTTAPTTHTPPLDHPEHRCYAKDSCIRAMAT